MRLRAMCHYSRGIVLTSVVLAIVISFVALWLTFHFRGEARSGALAEGFKRDSYGMGGAVPVRHYTGMAAASFTSSHSTGSRMSNFRFPVDFVFFFA
jgi:two-component system, sensor histidine kinase and response regulator